jgi:hypothetical protein
VERSVTATFDPTVMYTLTVSKSGTGGGTVTSDPSGIDCGSDCTESFASGAVVTLTATPDGASTFAGWSGAGCSGMDTCSVTMDDAKEVTAIFDAVPVSYTLTVAKSGAGSGTVTSNPAGISCGSDCSETYASGTNVTLSATPDGGSTFAGWSGGGCSGADPCSVTMSETRNVTAAFEPMVTYTLSVSTSGSGSGAVTSNPTGIDCGSDCSESYSAGTTVTLTATPQTGSTFAGWIGCDGAETCDVTMDEAKSVNAAFDAIPVTYVLTVTKSGTGSGTVTSVPAGITCGGDCSQSYSSGTTVTLAATSDAGSTFAGWSGAGCSGTNPCVVSMDAGKGVDASFSACTIAISPTSTKAPLAGGSGSVTVTAGPECAWTAVSNSSWITVTSGGGGNGVGSVDYVVTGTSGPPRSGSISIGDKALWVYQGEPFTDIGAALTAVHWGAAEWGDYDNDGDLDILLSGYVSGIANTTIYRNDGNGAFVDSGAQLAAVWGGDVAWGDYDRDGDLDILMHGYTGSTCLTKVYRNEGASAFVDIEAPLQPTYNGSVAWGDYDNDGDLDILITGWSCAGGLSNNSLVYRNDGNGAFVDVEAGLTAVNRSSGAWGDYDNDGNLDILLAGYGSPERQAAIFRNTGAGAFTDIGAPIEVVGDASVAWGDYDNDGSLDLALAGCAFNRYAGVYHQDAGGAFSETVSNLTGVSSGSVAWGDFDNDGDLDLVLAGSSSGDPSGDVTKVYRNDSAAGFSDIGASLTGVAGCTAALGDYDNDGDVDILLVGSGTAKVYRNDASVPNTVAAAPTGLSEHSAAGEVTLAWNAASDGQTPPSGLTYNLRVSRTPGGVDVFSPMASTDSGWRRVPQLGNVNHGTTARLRPVSPGIYYWSVQAIDSALAGSPFSSEREFTYCGASINPSSVDAAQAGGTGTVGVSIDGWCSWTAFPNNAWITVTSGSPGNGNGTVGYSVAANTGPARSGTITIGGQTFTVNQTGVTHQLVVIKDGAGSGVVASAPGGVDCGPDCSEDFTAGSVITLTATAAAASTFAGWSGEGCSGIGACVVTMSQARTVAALFVPSVASGFHPLAPCRVFDTRVDSGPGAGGPVLDSGERRLFTVAGSCNVPLDASAISVNLTVVGATALGDLRVTGGHVTSTITSALSVPLSRARANNALIGLSASGDGTIAVTNATGGTVHFILDINGYFR